MHKEGELHLRHHRKDVEVMHLLKPLEETRLGLHNEPLLCKEVVFLWLHCHHLSQLNS